MTASSGCDRQPAPTSAPLDPGEPVQGEGFTLLELLIVVALATMISLTVIRGAASNESDRKLAVAMSELAASLRFARSEAMRTGNTYGVRIDGAPDHRARVYKLNTSTNPPTEEFSVYHPIDKKLYSLELKDGLMTSGVEVVAANFLFDGDSDFRASVSFDATGTPVAPLDGSLMTAGDVLIVHVDLNGQVVLAETTGRVTTTVISP